MQHIQKSTVCVTYVTVPKIIISPKSFISIQYVISLGMHMPRAKNSRTHTTLIYCTVSTNRRARRAVRTLNTVLVACTRPRSGSQNDEPRTRASTRLSPVLGPCMYNPSSPLTVQRAGLLLSSLGSPPAHRVLAKCRPWTLQDGPMLRGPCQPSQREGELGSQRLSRAQQLGAQRQCRGLFGCHGRVCARVDE